jgi:hypothetical protein
MSDEHSDEHFLARWSRRKQEARGDHPEAAPEKKAMEVDGAAPSRPAAAEPVLSQTELLNLPPIESIDAATDITAFLREGIPQELSRAAFRRAWSADPAIRDFVGLAENAWDFNDPNAMDGFGPLDYSAEEVDALVHRVVGGLVQTGESLLNPQGEAAEEGARPCPAEASFAQSHPVKSITEPRPFEEATAVESRSNSAALQPAAPSEETSLPRRTHGGALPR